MSSLTKEILCEKHNNELSPIDTIGQRAFRTLQELARLSEVRRTLNKKLWTVKRYALDGPSLERWFLKMLINLCSGANHPIGADDVRAAHFR